MLPGHMAFSFTMSINRPVYKEEEKNISRAVIAHQKGETSLSPVLHVQQLLIPTVLGDFRREVLLLGSP